MENTKHIIAELLVQQTLKLKDPSVPNQFEESFLFDLREITLNTEQLQLLAKAVIDQCTIGVDIKKIQLASLESAGISLMTGLQFELANRFQKNINGLYIRKKRKVSGMMNLIEGVPNTDSVILIDDLINSGTSLWRGATILKEAGLEVNEIWTVLRLRDETAYARFASAGIVIKSLFELNDLTQIIFQRHGVRLTNLQPSPSARFHQPQWHFSKEKGSHNHIFQKSTPAIDDTSVYVGFDDNNFYALNRHTGKMEWSYMVRENSSNKAIASDPLLHSGVIYFASYNGCLHALTTDGKLLWEVFLSDAVGSSATIDKDTNVLYIGLEFNRPEYKGGIAALDTETGEVLWQAKHQNYTHCTPLYVSETGLVYIGSNDGILYVYDRKSGSEVWRYKTPSHISTTQIPLPRGFSMQDIKEQPVFTKDGCTVTFCSLDGNVVVLDAKTGTEVKKFRTSGPIVSSPLIIENRCYVTSVDKHLYAFDFDGRGEILYRINLDDTQIIATPTFHAGKLYIGTTGGNLHVLDAKSGKKIYSQNFTESLTTPVVISGQELILRTNGNSVYSFALPFEI